MTFTQAIQQASKQAKLSGFQRTALGHAVKGASSHPLLWAAAEQVVIYRYERETGQKIGGPGFDWSTVVQWLIQNLPMLISLLLTIFGA